jgi:dephospho-CoA kinase
MKIYGLTGGAGSGKSEAAKRFVERGIPVVEADRLGHEVIGPGGAAEQAVMDAFGTKILSCGRIDRERLAAVVFSDRAALERLNALVHPVIMAEVARACAGHAEAGKGAVVVEAALLAEHGRLDGWMSGLILVLCPEKERIRRLVELRGMSHEQAVHRIGAQMPPEHKQAIADWVIENDSTLAHLRSRVDEVAGVILHAADGS